MFNSVNPKVCTAAAEKRCPHSEASKAAEREQHTEKREGTASAGEAVRADTATAARVHFYHKSFTSAVSAESLFLQHMYLFTENGASVPAEERDAAARARERPERSSLRVRP